MAPEQQAKETAEFLEAYLAACDEHGWGPGEVCGEWTIEGTDHLGFYRKRLLYVGDEWRFEKRQMAGGWGFQAHRCPLHEAAANILLAIQPKLDEAGVEVRCYGQRHYEVTKDGDWELVDGKWMDVVMEFHPFEATVFTSRPLAMLAAWVAVRKEQA